MCHCFTETEFMTEDLPLQHPVAPLRSVPTPDHHELGCKERYGQDRVVDFMSLTLLWYQNQRRKLHTTISHKGKSKHSYKLVKDFKKLANQIQCVKRTIMTGQSHNIRNTIPRVLSG